MNEFDLLKTFGTHVRAEADPQIDVAGQVIQRIKQRKVGIVDRHLSLASLGACALSVAAIVTTWAAIPANDNLVLVADAAVKDAGPDALLKVLEP